MVTILWLVEDISSYIGWQLKLKMFVLTPECHAFFC